MNVDFLIGIFVFATIIGQVRLCHLLNMYFLIGLYLFAIIIGQVRFLSSNDDQVRLSSYEYSFLN